MSALNVADFRPLARNTLRGFVTVILPDGMRLHDCAVHVREGRAWASPPGRPIIGRDGAQLRGADGKPQFQPTVTFTSRADQDAFSGAVIEAVRRAHPEALT
jgi:hypothetical protein